MNKEIYLNVITVVRDDQRGLEKTLKSILHLSKKLKNLFINVRIQDGLSSDETVNFAKVFFKENESNNLTYIIISENDEGIFDAMNRASDSLKQNDLVLYLNAGDSISEDLDPNYFYESLLFFSKSSSKLCAFRSRNYFSTVSYFMPGKTIKDSSAFNKWIVNNTPVHQAVIFKFDEKFPIFYSTDFKIQSDSIFIYKYINKFGEPIFFNVTLCDFELGGLSNSYKSLPKVLNQINEQNLVSRLRGEGIVFILIRNISLLIKYFLHNLFGRHYFFIHALIKSKFIKN